MRNPDHLRPRRPDQEVILVAEDEVMIQNVVRLTLEAAGFSVLTAHDGLEALEVSRLYPGAIRLLVTDVLMPHMDGLELSRHIRAERPDTEVLVISGTHSPGIKLNYLAKPFTPAALRAAVSGLLSGHALPESGILPLG